MDMECLSIKMAKNIKVGLLKANSMVLALWLIFMGMKLKEPGLMEYYSNNNLNCNNSNNNN